MPTIAEVRQKFPQYNDMSDDALAGALHKKYYSDMPEADFRARIGLAAPQQQPTGREGAMGTADAFMRGAADTMSFGLADEIAAGGDALLNPIFGTGQDGGSISDRYNANLQSQRGTDASDADQHPISRIAGQVTGGVTGGLGLAKSGLSASANAINRGAGLGRVAAGGLIDGGLTSAAQGFGSGEGFGDRAYQAGVGGALGAGIGAAAPFAVAAGAKGLKSAVAPVMARLAPENYAHSALGEALQRAGMTPEQVASSMRAAGLDGQDMFTVADAMGNSGQRLLSTAARTPHNERQGIVDSLVGRQMDQGRRIAGDLQEASGSPLTAERFKEALTARRSEEAARNYAPVQSDTTAIDVSPAVDKANRVISPAADNIAKSNGAVPTDLLARMGLEANEASIRDPIRQAAKEARSYIASDKLTVTNVEKAFRAKTNIDMMIANATTNGQGAIVEQLMPIQNALDDALARTSKDYGAARDAYKAASGRIDAIDVGKDAARPRTRTADAVSSFSDITDQEARRAARVGYFDPKIAAAELSTGSMSNAARPYQSDAMRKQLPVFAAEGKGDQLMRRLGREQTMFETTATALGGSKTADNIADAADMAQFDPAIMARLLRGDLTGTLIEGVKRVLAEATGKQPRVVEQMAKTLIETDPAQALQLLSKSSAATAKSNALKAGTTAALLGSLSGGLGRL